MGAYVIKAENGQYIRGISAWEKTLTDDLQKARVYVNKGAATRSLRHIPRFSRGYYDPGVFSVVPVEIREAGWWKQSCFLE